MSKRELSPKRRRFVEEYLVDLNASAAARRAGYSEKTAGSQAFDLLQKPEIQEAVQLAMAARSERTEITQDMVLQELARIGFSDVREMMAWTDSSASFVPSHEIEDDQARAIQSVKSRRRTTESKDGDVIHETHELEVRCYDKVSALHKVGQHLGMFVNRHHHEGEIKGGVMVAPDQATLEDWQAQAAANQAALAAQSTEAAEAATAGNG